MYYIGIDLGTSAVKLLLVDGAGKIHRSVTKSYPLLFPQPGWAEQNPADWWKAVQHGILELTEHVDKSEIRGIGCGGQMHGLVVLDENDAVIRPAILWKGRVSQHRHRQGEALRLHGEHRLRGLYRAEAAVAEKARAGELRAHP